MIVKGRGRRWLDNEKGSATLEFLMVLPYYFLFFLLLWQAVASGLTFMKAQSAVNQAAKIYSVTNDENQAASAAREAIGASEMMTYQNLSISNNYDNTFNAKIELRHGFVFIPKEWRNRASVTLTQSVSGRVIK